MDFSIKSGAISPNLRLFLTTGLLGGLTTFSTFSYETTTLLHEGNYLLGALNISLNLFLSLGCPIGQIDRMKLHNIEAIIRGFSFTF